MDYVNNIIDKINLEISTSIKKELIYKSLEKLVSILNVIPYELNKDEVKKITQECPNLKILFNELELKFNDVINDDTEDFFSMRKLNEFNKMLFI